MKSQHDTDADGSLSDEDSEWTPRDHLGRPIGIWRQAPPSGGTTPCAKPYQVFAYHNTSFRGEGSDDSRGVLDAPAVRWRDTGSGDLDEMVSYLQDFRGDVRAVVSPSSGVLERERYGLTGRPEAFPAADVNFDGKVDEDDNDDFDQALLQYGGDTTKYDPRADLDRDGDVDSDDQSIFSASYSFYAGYGSQWRLSAGAGLAPGRSGGDAGLDNRFGWRGYWYDPHLRMYHVRNRAYDPRQGQFLQTDPLGFSAGDQNLYRYADGNFSSGYDPLGLECVEVIPNHPENGFSCSSDDNCPSGIPVLGGSRATWDQNVMDFFAGAADGITFGATAQLRHELGQDGVVDTHSGMYGAGVGVGVTLDIMIGGGSGAMAYMGTFEGAVVSGAGIGLLSNGVTQGAQMTDGTRQSFSAGELVGSGFTGAAAGAIGYGVGHYVVAPAFRAGGRVLGSALRGLGRAFGEAAGEAGAAEAGACAAAVEEAGTEAAGSGGRWFDNPEILTGSTANARNRAIRAVIAEDLPSLRLTHQPQYAPTGNFGLARNGVGTQIGPGAFSSRRELIDTIVHEELHHRWFSRGILSPHHAAGSASEARFYSILERYMRMRGWN